MTEFRRSMPGSRELGALGEERAVEFLVTNGYSLRERNFRCKIGEIDIVAEKSEYIVFVEVKARRLSGGFVSPFVSMSKKKIGKIRKVGQLYLAINEIENSQPRFDVIGIVFENLSQYTIEHIKNAF